MYVAARNGGKTSKEENDIKEKSRNRLGEKGVFTRREMAKVGKGG